MVWPNLATELLLLVYTRLFIFKQLERERAEGGEAMKQ